FEICAEDGSVPLALYQFNEKNDRIRSCNSLFKGSDRNSPFRMDDYLDKQDANLQVDFRLHHFLEKFIFNYYKKNVQAIFMMVPQIVNNSPTYTQINVGYDLASKNADNFVRVLNTSKNQVRIFSYVNLAYGNTEFPHWNMFLEKIDKGK
ncbi:MAG: hypothetical protein Q8807_02070, partial ['Waltheria sp.' little leaf phytoplasma]|nr:hypothetical protein ['Waltheria sp.' little leaf phytoplasma]